MPETEKTERTLAPIGAKTSATAQAEEPEPGEGAAPDPEEFERLLDMYDVSFKNFAEGEVVKGIVLQVSDSEVIVDVGYKSEGIIPLDEFRGEDGKIVVKTGDVVDVLLEKTEDKEGYVVLSKEKAEKMKIWDEVEKAYAERKVVTGRVIERVKGGLAVDIGVRAFLPGSQVDLRPVRNLDSLKGQELRMRVIKVNKKRGNIVLSRKAVLEEENAEKKRDTLGTLEEGKVLMGTVKNITEYGAFVDLGGIDGLLHITDMSWGRINHPSEVLNVGEEIKVQVLKFDRKSERVSLGYKQLKADPWTTATLKYPTGSRVKGKVVSLTDYGAFVEVEEGIDGLIHISDLSWTKRVKHPSEILKKGDTVEAVVLNIDAENQRLSLGLKQLATDMWDEFFAHHKVGDIVEGKIVRLTNFGAFVELAEGIEGLVHVSELDEKRIEKPEEQFKVGDVFPMKIIKMSPGEKKIGLSIKAVKQDEYQRDLEVYREAAGSDRSTLGDAFRAAEAAATREKGGE